MIRLHRLGNTSPEFDLNPDLILTVEPPPDTTQLTARLCVPPPHDASHWLQLPVCHVYVQAWVLHGSLEAGTLPLQ